MNHPNMLKVVYESKRLFLLIKSCYVYHLDRLKDKRIDGYYIR